MREKNRPEGATGVFNEKVWPRNENDRPRRPGRIVGTDFRVLVEYNDHDGRGPYQVWHNQYDVERAFAPYCGERIKHEDGTFETCDGLIQFNGICPRAFYHYSEKEK